MAKNRDDAYPRLWRDPGEKSFSSAAEWQREPLNSGTTEAAAARSSGTKRRRNGTESLLVARSTRATDLLPDLTLPVPSRRSLLSTIGSSLVVGQELALAVLLLAHHRFIVAESDEDTAVSDEERNTYAASLWTVTGALGFVVYRSERARFGRRRGHHRPGGGEGADDDDDDEAMLPSKREKLATRLSDALLLAAILRLLSAVLRTLTASYSSDTVAALSAGGMAVHLMACDYAYANGGGGVVAPPRRRRRFRGGTRSSSAASGRRRKKRPTFAGGTVSLNAALFSTTLLASRLPTNAASYGFVMTSVGLFAFYPDARHVISSRSTKEAAAGSCLVVTLAMSVSALLLLKNAEQIGFLCALFSICGAAPVLRWWLQQYKTIIAGPWDIAHIVVADDGAGSGSNYDGDRRQGSESMLTKED